MSEKSLKLVWIQRVLYLYGYLVNGWVHEASWSSRLRRLSKTLWRPLALLGGVVSLAVEGWFELDGGDEERAGLADRLEVAVHFGGSSAVAVAEHAAVHLGAEPAHLAAFVVSGKLAWLAVERFDLLVATRGRTVRVSSLVGGLSM